MGVGKLILEISGSATGLLYVWLEIKHRRSMWVVGILMSLCYMVVFGVEGLYASMGLYVYYLGMSLYGWVQWGRQEQQEQQEQQELRPVRITGRQAVTAGGLLVTSFFIMWLVLGRLTDHPAPVPDAAIAALNITATWLLTHSVLEQWLLLLIANALAIGLYARTGLWFTTGLYVVFLISSVAGYISWQRKIL
ncbi:MAG TPA: nicotinamide riboside transporter PnuC [Bacteroidales bacterium]|nr:MAG: Nicotinamide riboside transporter PnuC [Bacteroidetes bacterium ADurb.Bin139]HOG25651.1 nicotinamide riboside transporter PnuC [Bacteroidales bacterium]HOR11940.1 nicotinamide riboside transporter PnuC [Bacteroidales bacterium]HPB77922.1 nicotinamide riboside transporter PnuC [Bacteroidales bacterium]HQP64445.1 nicotinamide riboside transporter PnuC [Bacteroidales bacterium]